MQSTNMKSFAPRIFDSRISLNLNDLSEAIKSPRADGSDPEKYFVLNNDDKQ
jgi:hypothetical protein